MGLERESNFGIHAGNLFPLTRSLRTGESGEVGSYLKIIRELFSDGQGSRGVVWEGGGASAPGTKVTGGGCCLRGSPPPLSLVECDRSAVLHRLALAGAGNAAGAPAQWRRLASPLPEQVGGARHKCCALISGGGAHPSPARRLQRPHSLRMAWTPLNSVGGGAEPHSTSVVTAGGGRQATRCRGVGTRTPSTECPCYTTAR